MSAPRSSDLTLRALMLLSVVVLSVAAPGLSQQGEVLDHEAAADETACESTEAQPSEDDAKDSFRERWKTFIDAFRGLTTWRLFDDRLTLQIGGRFQADATAARASELLEANVGSLDNSVELRRLRLFADGTIDHHLRYLISYDFGANISLGDVFVEGLDRGLTIWGYDIGRFRLGHFQEPFSLERMTSSYWIGFLERSLPVQTFAPGRNLGFMLSDMGRSERFSWAAGFFSFGSRNEENASGSALSITGRVTGLPVYRNNGRTIVHVGASYSTREPQSSEVRYQSRPEARYLPHLVDTGDLSSGKNRLYGIEAAGQHGPLWLQAEWITTDVDSSEHGNLRFQGGYVQAGYFLTGETRPYNTSNGTFQRLMPENVYHGGAPLRPASGGAFEVTARLSAIDLDDGQVHGGHLTDFSIGLNWYPRHTQRVMLDYIRAKVEDGGHADILLLRYQYRLR